jgi:hypothetical protein
MPVNSSAPKKAMMHHALPKQKKCDDQASD